jgi:aspartate carbamoyltransferase regulatory subunit
MSDTLSVSAIKNGTVIDHIPQGQALRIIRLLTLLKRKFKIMVGMNLPSKRLGTKDLIKIENHIITEQEANEIVVFAPPATINVIKEFEVIKKISTHLPESMKAVFACPNPVCITQTELVDSCFYIREEGKQITLTCHYCEKAFHRDQVKVKI